MMGEAGDLMVGEPSGTKGKAKVFQHPTYTLLIYNAINALKQRGGSSTAAIRKTIEKKMGPKLGPNYKKIVGSTLSKLAKTGKLIRTGNTFKLTREFKQEQQKRLKLYGRRVGGQRKRNRQRNKRKPRRPRFKIRIRKKVRIRELKRGRRRRISKSKKSTSSKRNQKRKKRSGSPPPRPANDSVSEKKTGKHASHVHIHQGDKSDNNCPLNTSP